MKSSQKKKTNLLLNRVNEYVKKAYTFKRYKKDPIFSPSSLSSPCVRKIFYSYLQVEPDSAPDVKGIRIFKTGDAMHDMIKDWVRNSEGVDFVDYLDPKTGKIPVNYFTKLPDPEFVVMDTDLPLKGKIDGVIILEGKLWMIEIKSSNERKFRTLKAADPTHADQAMQYAFVFELNLKEGKYSHISKLDGFTEVAGVIFLYINKDTSELKEFVSGKDESVFIQTLEKIADVKAHVSEKKLPPMTEDYCNYCPFQKKCLKSYNPL